MLQSPEIRVIEHDADSLIETVFKAQREKGDRASNFLRRHSWYILREEMNP